MNLTDVEKIRSVDLTTITPSFKQLDYLGCCMMSVADQEGVSVEHIVQDAGSPGIEEFAEEMGERLLRKYGGEKITNLEKFELLHIRTANGYTLRIFKEKDDGMYDAINKGIEKATGPICGYLNCDEQYLNSALLRVKEAFDKEIEIGVVLGDVIIINRDGEAICHRKIETPTLAHTWTCHFSALAAAVFFRKSEISEGLLFDISYRMASDAEWFVRILRSRLVIEVLRTNISTFMEGGQNLILSPAAEKERERLNASAPFLYRKLKILWVALHRIKRLIGRPHRFEDVAYEVYLPKSDKRKAFYAKRLRTTWPTGHSQLFYPRKLVKCESSVQQLDFTIITPSFKQLDYLGCCIASVADQGTGNGGRRTEDGGQGGSEGMCESGNVAPLRSVSAGSLSYAGLAERLSVEHIVQDAGSPGIEEFAKKMGEQLLKQYGGEQVSNLETFELLHIRTAHGYTLRIFKEKDSGMYDAVNRGLKKGTGTICAYLNCDEQYLVGALELVRTVFKGKAQTEVAFGGVAIVSPQGKLIARRMACHLSYAHVMTCHLPNFTAAMFFRREFLIKRAAWFDVAYRDLADAVWVMARMNEGTKIQRVSVITTSFTDTGANMNLSPNARREARELRESAPKWIKALKPWWKFTHRSRKFLEGQYWPTAMKYAIYLGKATGERTEFKATMANPLWWDRLNLKN